MTLQGLDNKNMDADMTGVDTNKVAESIYAEKTAKLHRLLGEKEEKGFRLDLESPESEKLTDSVSEKEEKEVDEVEEEKEKAAPVRRRVKKRSELPLGWEKHEVRSLLRFSNGDDKENDKYNEKDNNKDKHKHWVKSLIRFSTGESNSAPTIWIFNSWEDERLSPWENIGYLLDSLAGNISSDILDV